MEEDRPLSPPLGHPAAPERGGRVCARDRGSLKRHGAAAIRFSLKVRVPSRLVVMMMVVMIVALMMVVMVVAYHDARDDAPHLVVMIMMLVMIVGHLDVALG